MNEVCSARRRSPARDGSRPGGAGVVADGGASGPQPLEAGRVGAPHGVRGWLHLRSFLQPPELLFECAPLAYRDAQQGWRPLPLLEVRPHGRDFLVRLDGVDDRDAAALLRGCAVGVQPDALPAPEAGEYYWSDLLGCRVETVDGVELGRLGAFMETGANDVMVVAGADRERLVPFADGVVVEVDLSARLVRVDWVAED